MLGSVSDFKIILRDITQAYTQSKTKVSCPHLFHSSSIINISSSMLLSVYWQLYGLSKTGLHWFGAYHERRPSCLSIPAAVHGSFLWHVPAYIPEREHHPLSHQKMTTMQIDDMLKIGKKSFLQDKE